VLTVPRTKTNECQPVGTALQPYRFIPDRSPAFNPNEVAATATSRGNRTTPSRGNKKTLHLVMYCPQKSCESPQCEAKEERHVDEIMRGLRSTLAQTPLVRFSALSMWMDLVGGRAEL